MVGKQPEPQQMIKSGGDVMCGVVTFFMAALAFAACDDITTDNATSFVVEYLFLLVFAGWALFLAARLAWTRRIVLAGASFLVLGAAIWGQRLIGPGTIPSWQPEYIATAFALVWFLGLSLFLTASGFRVERSKAPVPDAH